MDWQHLPLYSFEMTLSSSTVEQKSDQGGPGALSSAPLSEAFRPWASSFSSQSLVSPSAKGSDINACPAPSPRVGIKLYELQGLYIVRDLNSYFKNCNNLRIYFLRQDSKYSPFSFHSKRKKKRTLFLGEVKMFMGKIYSTTT